MVTGDLFNMEEPIICKTDSMLILDICTTDGFQALFRNNTAMLRQLPFKAMLLVQFE
jgi:hypothetical protein